MAAKKDLAIPSAKKFQDSDPDDNLSGDGVDASKAEGGPANIRDQADRNRVAQDNWNERGAQGYSSVQSAKTRQVHVKETHNAPVSKTYQISDPDDIDMNDNDFSDFSKSQVTERKAAAS